MMQLITFVLLCVACSHANGQQGAVKNLKLVSEWKALEFAFPSPQIREAAIANGQYIAGNAVPIDVDVDYRDGSPSRIFVSIPRFVTGIPVTFGIVTSGMAAGGPIIQAYPDYSWHNSHGRNCDGITSVFRVAIDECRRLWILDTGRIGATQHCAPQLLVFNLDTDTLIHRYRFPADQFRPGTSNFVTIVLDVRDPPPAGRCVNTVAYIADVTGYGILVYDARLNRSWRVQNKLVFPIPQYGTFTIANESFDLMDGILGLALSPRRQQARGKTYGNFHIYNHNHLYGEYPTRSDRSLYFHALASNTENCVPLDVLNNSTTWLRNVDSTPRAFREIGTRQSQSAAEAMDRNGNLFFGLMDPIAVACWDSDKPYTQENMRLVAQNDATLQFSSGVKVILNRKNQEELWVLSCRFQKVMAGTINQNEVNFRIQALQVDELLDGTKCTGGGSHNNGGGNHHHYSRH